MKRITRRILFCVAGVVIGAVLIYGIVLIDLRAEPNGYVASYSLFAHSKTDVLNFSHGKVILQTCCGDEDWGTYEDAPGASWIWHLRGKGFVKAMDFRVSSGPFSMTFTETGGQMEPFTLRRRAFRNVSW
jgi:hypothetical protein